MSCGMQLQCYCVLSCLDDLENRQQIAVRSNAFFLRLTGRRDHSHPDRQCADRHCRRGACWGKERHWGTLCPLGGPPSPQSASQSFLAPSVASCFSFCLQCRFKPMGPMTTMFKMGLCMWAPRGSVCLFVCPRSLLASAGNGVVKLPGWLRSGSMFSFYVCCWGGVC